MGGNLPEAVWSGGAGENKKINEVQVQIVHQSDQVEVCLFHKNEIRKKKS